MSDAKTYRSHDHCSCRLVQNYDSIVYISCNPNTLRDNLDTICTTHRIARVSALPANAAICSSPLLSLLCNALQFAVFDQFPYTDHLECGAYLVRI